MSANAVKISIKLEGDQEALIYATGIADYPAFLGQIVVTMKFRDGGELVRYIDTFDVGGNRVSPNLTQLKVQVSAGVAKIKSVSAQAFYWSANQIAEASVA